MAVLSGLARAYAAAGQVDPATSFGAAAYTLAPANPLVVDAYGWVLYRAGNPGAALPLLRKAAVLAPADPAIAAHLAEVAG